MPKKLCMSKQSDKNQSPTDNPKAVSVSDEPLVIAHPIVRLLALMYDGMLILAMLFLTGTIGAVIGTLLLLDVGQSANQAQELPIWYQNGVLSPIFILTLVGFYGVFWRKSGQTLGMQTWRIKTVTAHGKLLLWRQSFGRILSACLLPLLCATVGGVLQDGERAAVWMSTFLGFLFNYLFCFVNRQGLAVHDILSNTMTLKVPKIQHESLWQSFRRRAK